MAFSNGGQYEVDVNKRCSVVMSETDWANDWVKPLPRVRHFSGHSARWSLMTLQEKVSGEVWSCLLSQLNKKCRPLPIQCPQSPPLNLTISLQKSFTKYFGSTFLENIDEGAVDSTYWMLKAEINWLQTLDKCCASVMNTDTGEAF